MAGGTSSHAPRPDAATCERSMASSAQASRSPFASADIRRVRGTGRPDEPPGSDRWTAVRSAFLLAVMLALVTWVLLTLARG